MMDLRGFVDYFDGTTLCGWAMDGSRPDRTCSVDILIDDVQVATVAADQRRGDLEAVSPGDPDHAFQFQLEPPVCAPGRLTLHTIPKIAVKHAGTDIHLLVVPGLLGVVNEDRYAVAETVCIYSDNRFLPTPPRSMIEHVAGDGTTDKAYRAVGMYLVLELLHFGLLTDRSCAIADVGCGTGRVATHLAPLTAEEGGTYTGFDTWAAGIRWAQEHVTPVYPSFRFELLGGPASRGKDPGYVGTNAYPLSLADSSTDLVLASSVFTHLTPDAAAAYLEEFRRVLKPDGWAYITFFIYDDEARQVLSRRKLRLEEHGAVFTHPSFFDTYFYPEVVDGLVADSGFEAVIDRKGFWRGDQYKRGRRFGYQDLLLLRPRL